MTFLSDRRGKFKILGLQGDSPPSNFPCLVGHCDLHMRKTLRVIGPLTAFFQNKKITACKVKDEKEETISLFFDSVQSTEDYPSI